MDLETAISYAPEWGDAYTRIRDLASETKKDLTRQRQLQASSEQLVEILGGFETIIRALQRDAHTSWAASALDVMDLQDSARSIVADAEASSGEDTALRRTVAPVLNTHPSADELRAVDPNKVAESRATLETVHRSAAKRAAQLKAQLTDIEAKATETYEQLMAAAEEAWLCASAENVVTLSPAASL